MTPAHSEHDNTTKCNCAAQSDHTALLNAVGPRLEHARDHVKMVAGENGSRRAQRHPRGVYDHKKACVDALTVADD